MAENKLKERWKAGKAAVNGWLAIPSGFSAEVMAQCGWDSVTVDMQHGVQDYQTMVQCVITITNFGFFRPTTKCGSPASVVVESDADLLWTKRPWSGSSALR
jgi:2-keto-3-deoxy-L-rhamnonate aldolase RhmA